MTANLAGKSVLVTGGGSGMGWAIAKALAACGCRVAISGRNTEKLRVAAATFTGQPAIVFAACDVANRAAVKQLVSWATKELGRIDILINSAGVNIKNRTMEAMRPEQWDEVLAANATGAYNLMYEVLPQMRARRDGLIINISSTSGKRAGKLGGVAYNASKFALTALTTSVAQEEAPNGIRVTSVFPGEVNTPILEQRPNPVSDEHKAAILQPDDIAAIVVPLCSLPPNVHVPELVIKPLRQDFV